ncbi:MAG: N-6 DNA methylase [Bdellovibrionota bacterium]
MYSAESKNKFSAYYEVNISKFLEERDDDAFKAFYNFFRKEAFIPDSTSSQSYLDVVFLNGETYAAEVEKKLKNRAFHLVELIAQGFAESNDGLTEKDLEPIYHHSLFYLFRLLFILNAEAKGLLNVGNQSDYYPYSLRKLCEEIRSEKELNTRWPSISSSYNKIDELITLIQKGDSNIGIHAFGNEIFSSGDARFFKNYKISDKVLKQVLLELSCLQGKDSKWRFVDYKRLSSDHLGSIFEGLLEFSLLKKSKTVELVNADGKREAQGAYYTPDYIVDYIVESTLAPLVKNKTPEEMLQIKVADIAMGSGHFLLGVVRYLESCILEALSESENSEIDPSEVKWLVLHNCIYGFDINPIAVELAKYSMWIFSARQGMELEPLSDQMIQTDSLLELPKNKTFREKIHAIVGNPPYVRSHKQSASYKERLKDKYRWIEGDFDIYPLFFHSGFEMLCNNGRLGFIVPNKLFSREYAFETRKFLAEDTTITDIVDLGKATDVFEVATYTCLLMATKSKPKATGKIKTLQVGVSAVEDLPEFASTAIELKQSELKNEKWILPTKDDDLLTLVEDKLGTISNLSELFKFDLFCGTPRAKDYYEWANYLSDNKNPNSKKLKYFVCKSITPFCLNWGPKISSLKKKLENPTFDVSKADLSANLESNFRTKPKLLIRGNDYRMTAALDEEGSVFVGVYGLIPSKQSELSILEAWLNSSIGNFIFKVKNPSLGLSGGYFSINSPHIEQFPTPERISKIASKFDSSSFKKSKSDSVNAQVFVDKFFAKELGISDEIMAQIYEVLGEKSVAVMEKYGLSKKGKGKKAA